MRKLHEGASAVPQVRESSATTVHAEARQEYAPGGTTPDSRVPVLLGGQGKDVFHLPGLEKSPVGHTSPLHEGGGSALAGRVCLWYGCALSFVRLPCGAGGSPARLLETQKLLLSRGL